MMPLSEDPYINSLLATISDLKENNSYLKSEIESLKDSKLKIVSELNELMSKVLRL